MDCLSAISGDHDRVYPHGPNNNRQMGLTPAEESNAQYFSAVSALGASIGMFYARSGFMEPTQKLADHAVARGASEFTAGPDGKYGKSDIIRMIAVQSGIMDANNDTMDNWEENAAFRNFGDEVNENSRADLPMIAHAMGIDERYNIFNKKHTDLATNARLVDAAIKGAGTDALFTSTDSVMENSRNLIGKVTKAAAQGKPIDVVIGG